MNFLDNMTLTKKFAILGVIGLLLQGIPSWFFIKSNFALVDSSMAEVNGLEPERLLIQLIHDTQKHRGLSGVVLAGDSSAEAKRHELQISVDSLFEKLEKLANESSDDDSFKAQVKTVHGHWKEVSDAFASGRVAGADNFANHVALVSDLLVLNDSLIDAYGLSLDPDGPTYHLVISSTTYLPALTEYLGQLRGRGAAILAAHKASAIDRASLLSVSDNVKRSLGQFQREVEKFKTADPKFYEGIKDDFDTSSKAVASMLLLVRDSVVQADDLNYPSDEYFKQASKVIDAQYAMEDKLIPELSALLEARVSDGRWQLYEMLAGLVLLTLTGFAVAYGISRSIQRGMGEAVRAAHSVASGDLSLRFDGDRQDEVGQVLSAMKKMSFALRDMVSTVRGSSDQVAVSAQQLTENARDIAQASETQNRAVTTMAATVEEMSTSINSVADNAKDVSQRAEHSLDVTAQGHDRMNGLNREMERITQAVEAISSSITAFIESASQIAGMTRQVKDIADQTNLLALNAAIEAARAGEQGRGFAVVADEVRKLAEKSGQSASHIDEVTNALTLQSQQLERTVDQSRTAVESSTRHLTEVMEAMSVARSAVEEASQGVGDISVAVNQQSVAINQIAQNVETSAGMTAQTAETGKMTFEAAKHLEELALQLQRSMERFKTA